MSVSLAELVTRGLALETWGDASTLVRGVRHDSRAVEQGDLFVAIAGERADGAKFAGDALARGAVAVATQDRLSLEVPQLHVRDARAALPFLAAAVYGDPTAKLRVIGLTGTNGKTTTCWLIEQALHQLGQKPALLGTVESRGPGFHEPAPFTTPEGDAIARFARRALDAGATHLVMEVSSHALALHRADAVHFGVAAYTNLTQDHLDFHGTMEAYFAAKARLFLELAPERSVVLIDDAWGERLAGRISRDLMRVSRRADADAELRALSWSMERHGIEAELEVGRQRVALRSPLLGAHNLDNLLVALGALVSLGHDPAQAAAALAHAKGAPGRLERVEGLPDVAILVDYAHTPDAIARALAALRPITPGRLIVVFGCGGDRDRGKRPLMGQAAARGADLMVVTSDNPRTEDPFAILREIEPGLSGVARLSDEAGLTTASRGYLIIEDRSAAIARAVAAAGPGDTILIAGKGHEDYQIRGTTKHHFDDREQAASAIAAREGVMATPIPDNQAEFSAAELRAATDAMERVAAASAVRGVVTDSRRARASCLFVALRGEHHDGHDFVADVCEAGAGALLVDRELSAPAGVGVYESQDTLRALGGLGAFHRRRFDLPLLAITGSIGKTSTKDLVAAALAGLGRDVLATQGNLNNRIGAPLTLLGLEARHQAAVLELGMNEPGEIAELTACVRPTVGMVTAVTEAHLEGVGGIDGVAREKGALLTGLDASATAVWCADYPQLAPHVEASPAHRKISYGCDERADVRLLEWEMDATPSTRCAYRLEGEGEVSLTLRQLGKGAALNVAGVLAALRALELGPVHQALAALASAPATPGRMVPVPLVSDVLGIDDSYNASPRAVSGALETCAALAQARGGRLIAVLGDMLELGMRSEALHAEVGREAVRVGASVLVACGSLMAHAAKAGLAAAMDRPRASRTRVVFVKEVEAAAECAREAMQARDVVLIKGSRGMRMERVLTALAGGEA